ncbi:DNA repair protein XRCC4-like isoform X3 [Channa argus]|uniref:DNA repair protein XRCC4-like isoform X3 n=1 Tax=Channa argus TaxID=215402 RepID=UPI003521282A
MQVSVQEIHILSEPESRYFLRVDRKGQNFGAGFLLLLTNGQDAWKGEAKPIQAHPLACLFLWAVSEAAVYEEAEELEMQKERYIQDLQQALTGTTGSVAYSFTLTPSPPKHSSTVTLEYEKVQKDISFRLGSVLLKAVPQPAEAVTDLLIHSLQRGNTLEQHNQKLEEENQRLRKEHERITTDSDTRRKRDSVKSDQSAAQEEEAEEDEYGGSTDEEPEEVQSPPAPALRSMEATTPSPLDDSLKDITDVAPCRKRRVRHLRAPDLAVKRPNPDTSHRKSSDSPAGTSKKETPQRSADAASLSAEDLFEDF